MATHASRTSIQLGGDRNRVAVKGVRRALFNWMGRNNGGKFIKRETSGRRRRKIRGEGKGRFGSSGAGEEVQKGFETGELGSEGPPALF